MNISAKAIECILAISANLYKAELSCQELSKPLRQTPATVFRYLEIGMKYQVFAREKRLSPGKDRCGRNKYEYIYWLNCAIEDVRSRLTATKETERIAALEARVADLERIVAAMQISRKQQDSILDLLATK